MPQKVGKQAFSNKASGAGGVEVAGSNPVSPTVESSGRHAFPRGFSSLKSSTNESPSPPSCRALGQLKWSCNTVSACMGWFRQVVFPRSGHTLQRFKCFTSLR